MSAQPAIATTREGIHALGPPTPAGQRLAESLEFFEFLRAEMPAMLARWHKQKAGKPTRRKTDKGPRRR